MFFGDNSCDSQQACNTFSGSAETSFDVGQQPDLEIETKGEKAAANVDTNRARREVSERFALETNAVRLSLLVHRSSMESGRIRQCWHDRKQSSDHGNNAAARMLRPITITFSESRQSPRGSLYSKSSELHHQLTPLVSSLKHFRLTA
jgi:hypothetical protein